MPMPFVDKTGNRYGNWVVQAFAGRDGRKATQWLCKCDCGTERIVVVGSLTQRKSTSCGCMAVELRSKKMVKHGMASTPTYKSWHAMIQRTEGKGGHESYPLRNIDVCNDWKVFDRFFADMGTRPDGKTLDRIDNSNGYSKENCRWATPKEQSNNRGDNRIVHYKGISRTITEIGREFSINVNTIRGRLRLGWSVEKAIEQPVARK